MKTIPNLNELIETIKSRCDESAKRVNESIDEHNSVIQMRSELERHVKALERRVSDTVTREARYKREIDKILELSNRAAVALAVDISDIRPQKIPASIKQIITKSAKFKRELIDGSVKIETGPQRCGIYFLIDVDEVVYVGQSINIISRVSEHASDTRKKFDRFSCMDVDRSLLNETENFYITLFQPRHNVKGKSRVAESLIELCS